MFLNIRDNMKINNIIELLLMLIVINYKMYSLNKK